MEFDVELDARELDCPMPILKAKKCLQTMDTGQVLRVLATDPASVPDFNAFSRITGHVILDIVEQTPYFIFYIKKI